MSTEHRKHRRFDVALAGELTVGGEPVAVSTSNLSAGGVGVLYELELQDGSEVDVTLFLTQDGIEDPDVEPFETTGVVRWVAPRDDGLFLVGLQFKGLADSQQQQLEHFLVVVDDE